MNNTTKQILIVLGVIVLGAAIYYGIKHPGLTPEQKLEQAQTNLFNDAPRVKTLYTSLMKDYQIIIKPEQLTGDTEGRTVITETSATVSIDVNKVAKKHDRLEPVLAHELFHISDAKLVYGFDKFFALVEADKSKNWWDREVEISAYNQEDDLRKELIKTGKYGGMASTRKQQNNRK
jgi:hypothetical protein